MGHELPAQSPAATGYSSVYISACSLLYDLHIHQSPSFLHDACIANEQTIQSFLSLPMLARFRVPTSA